MKKLFFFLALSTCLSFWSCSDDDSVPADFMTATIDGSSFDAAQITALGDATLGELIIFIAGTNSDASAAIGLNIPASTPVDMLNVVDETDFGITFTDDADNAFFTVGEVTLTKHEEDNKVMEGNFNFTATQDGDSTNVYQVSDGSFRVTYN